MFLGCATYLGIFSEVLIEDNLPLEITDIEIIKILSEFEIGQENFILLIVEPDRIVAVPAELNSIEDGIAQFGYYLGSLSSGILSGVMLA